MRAATIENTKVASAYGMIHPGESSTESGGRCRSLKGRLTRAIGALAALFVVLSIFLVLPWRWVDPPTTTFIQLYGGDEPKQTWVEWDQISPFVSLALVASEDQRFPQHHGIDLIAVQEVLEEEGSRGASTITQQVAKNLYLWSGRSWVRKGLEAGLSVLIDLLWPKRRILEVYMNVAQFGPDVFGVQAASQIYLGRAAIDVTDSQAAMMAVVLPSPRRMSLAAPSEYMRERAAWVSEQMRLLGGPSYLSDL